MHHDSKKKRHDGKQSARFAKRTIVWYTKQTHRARHKAHKCHILNTNAMMKESKKTTVAREEGSPAESPSHTGIF
jgi:hypothetical protein